MQKGDREMNAPTRQEIRAKLQKCRQDDRERMRGNEEAMDAFAVQAVQALTEGLRVGVEDPESSRLGPSADETPIEATPATRAGARRAIEVRRQRPASSSPAPEPGQPPLRAALRGIVEDYAQAVTPSERLVSDLEAFSGIALDEADAYGLWADLELAEVLAVRAAMRDVVDIVTDRAEAIIIAELVAAQERLALEYPDVPRPDLADANDLDS
jgi:hypothetical protein